MPVREPPQRILLIKPSSLGDIVHALPVLAAVRRQWPQAHIAWLAGSTFAPVLAGHPLLDEVIPFDRARFGRMWRSVSAAREFLRFVRALRARRFDLVIDLQGLLRSALLARMCGARHVIGFADAREGGWLLYNTRVPVPPGEQHAVEKLGAVCAALGIPFNASQFPLGLHAEELEAARRKLRASGLAPGAEFIAALPGARWNSKLWPEQSFAELLDRLAETGAPPVVMLGAPDEHARAAEIAMRSAAPPLNLVGKTSLRELAAILALARAVVSQDSGPMHVAAALDRPLIALFGPTNPVRTGPWSQRARVIQLPLACSPCYRRECPLGHHDCLRTLDAARVVDAVRESLALDRAIPAAR